MKILQFIDSLAIGGAERVALTIASLLEEENIDNAILRRYPIGGLENNLPKNRVLLDLNTRHKLDISAYRKFAKIATSYDVVHIHLRGSLMFAYIASLCTSFSMMKVVFHDHYGDIDFDKSAPLLLKWALKKIKYVGVSKSLNNWALQDIGLLDSNISLIENIVLPVINDTPKQLTWKPEKWVMVGNFRPTKNQLLAVNILHLWNNKGNAAHLTFIGQVNDISYYESLIQKVKELGLNEYVTFMLDCTEPQKTLPAFTLGIHTATSETGPLSIIEMMAQSLPFVSTPTGEVAKQIIKEYPDFIASGFEPTDFIFAMQNMLDRPRPEAVKMVQGIFNTWFEKAPYLQKLMTVWHSVIKKCGGTI